MGAYSSGVALGGADRTRDDAGNYGAARSSTEMASAEVWAAAGHKLSVVIPAYNEEDGIADILERVLAVEPAVKATGIAGFEVIVVDDGSKDRTADIVRGYPGVRLAQHKVNRNYGGALKTGFHTATGDMLAFLDADGTYPPEYLPQLCREVLNGADMCVGSRMAGAKNDSPLVRQVGNFMFARLVSLIGNTRVTDVASGMRVFRRAALPLLYPLPDGLNFTPAMSTRAIHENLKLAEVAIPHSERLGDSKLGVIRDGMRFLSAILWTALAYNPVRILGLIGMAGVGLAALILGGLLAARLSGITQIDQWGVFAVTTALVSVVAGVSLFNLGAMFNYLVTLFQKRPIRQGMFGRPIFARPLERHFWWMGGVSIMAGLVVGAVSLFLSFGGWDISRLWLWLLGATMLILIGVQFVISFIVMRVLNELSRRDAKVDLDLQGNSIL